MVNGEIYNHAALRAEFPGYPFQGRSDCEVILPLYEKYGPAFLKHLQGQFSLCLYDERQRFFLAARDEYGILPLFWTVCESRLLIASEFRALTCLGWRPQWDLSSLVLDGHLTNEQTAFQGLYKVLSPSSFVLPLL